MKKLRLTSCIMSVILLIGILCSCGNTKTLSGRYVCEGSGKFSYIEFFPDGKYTSSDPNYEGDYSINGNRIRLEGILVDSKVYYFKVKGKTLELSYTEDFEDPDIYKK